MTATNTHEHQLPQAQRQLTDAITKLIDPKPQLTNGQLRYTQSLYTQLTDAIPGQYLGRTGLQRSQPPLWIDAADLLTEINTTTRAWHPDTIAWFTGFVFVIIPIHHTTPGRLRLLAQCRWRPQDTAQITRYANQIETWIKRIETLFAEHHVKHLPAPCPACDKKIVYRRDSAGELVRQPALQITTNGCECQACHTIWGPELFMHLARVLGYPTPAGVLE